MKEHEGGFLLAETVLDAVFAAGVSPFDRAVNAGNHAGTTFETTGKFYNHLSFLVEGVEVCRASIDAESFLTGVAYVLIEKDMGFLVIFKSIQS